MAKQQTKKPAAKKAAPKTSVLKQREAYLSEIGFEFNPTALTWTSPHATAVLSRKEITVIAVADYPQIFDYYKRKGEFSQELFDKICEEIATSSKSTRQVCKDNGIQAASSFYRWINRDEEDQYYGGKLRNTYARAKEDQVEFLVDEMLEIADDGSNDLMTVTKGDFSYETEDKEVTNRSRLRVDVRKYIASKLKPKKYGDSLDLKSNGETMKQVVVFQIPDNGRDNKEQ